MSEAQAPAAWWEEVEHLREAAERRIAERERAQREGRDPVALPPLRPLRDAERRAGPSAEPPRASRPLQPPAATVRTGRFGRNRGTTGEPGPGATAARGRTTGPVAGPATATALAVEFDIDAVPEDIWRAEADLAIGLAELETPEAPDLAGDAPEAAAPARDRDNRRGAAHAAPATTRRLEERPTRREELSRLAREQARAGTASRPRGAEAAARPARAGAPAAARRTVEIRGRAEARAAIAAVPDPVDAARYQRARRPRRSPADRFVAQPDRVALWAFLLGVFLIIVALLSAH